MLILFMSFAMQLPPIPEDASAPLGRRGFEWAHAATARQAVWNTLTALPPFRPIPSLGKFDAAATECEIRRQWSDRLMGKHAPWDDVVWELTKVRTQEWHLTTMLEQADLQGEWRVESVVSVSAEASNSRIESIRIDGRKISVVGWGYRGLEASACMKSNYGDVYRWVLSDHGLWKSPSSTTWLFLFREAKTERAILWIEIEYECHDRGLDSRQAKIILSKQSVPVAAE